MDKPAIEPNKEENKNKDNGDNLSVNSKQLCLSHQTQNTNLESDDDVGGYINEL